MASFLAELGRDKQKKRKKKKNPSDIISALTELGLS